MYTRLAVDIGTASHHYSLFGRTLKPRSLIIQCRLLRNAFIGVAFIGVALGALNIDVVSATTRPEAVKEEAGIEQRLNQQIDLGLRFRGIDGSERTLREWMIEGRPLVIAPVYYQCPRLCSLTLNGVSKLINELDLKLGEDYKVLAITFNSAEGVDLAKAKAENYFKTLTAPERATKGWDFLSGGAEPIAAVMGQLGFRFTPDGADFIHAAGIMLVTPEGRLSRYFTGVDFPTREVRYSLIEASMGKIGSITDHVFLYCFRFDPTKGKYSLVIWNVTRVICAVGVLAVVTLLLYLRRSERRPETGC